MFAGVKVWGLGFQGSVPMCGGSEGRLFDFKRWGG